MTTRAGAALCLAAVIPDQLVARAAELRRDECGRLVSFSRAESG